MDDWTKILGIGGAGGGIGFIVAMLIRSAMLRSDTVDKRYDTLLGALEKRVDHAENAHAECLEKAEMNTKRIGSLEHQHQDCLDRADKLTLEVMTLQSKVTDIEKLSSKH